MGLVVRLQAEVVSDTRLGLGRVPDVATAVGHSIVLGRSQLVAQVCEDRGLVFLDLRSSLDPAQSLLLSLGHRPVLAGISSFTRLGAVHARCWGLAFGVGKLPDHAVVRFESGRLRYETRAESAVRRLSRDCWVADAEGVFSRAVLLVDGEHARVPLTEQR